MDALYQKDMALDSCYAQARNYQPKLGRFTSEDPVRSNQNWFVYCSNNPLAFIDPSGLKDDDPCDMDIISLAKSWIGGIVDNIRASDLAKTITGMTQSGELDKVLSLLGFARDDKGIFHTRPDCWQQYFGYNDAYDFFFDAGTSMDVRKFEFSTKDEEFTIWMWKGDYINLGASAETGIYYGGGPHWTTGVPYSVPMTLELYDKEGDPIFEYQPDENQWWITGFNPSYQETDAGDLSVAGTIDFSDFPELWQSFYKKYGSQSEYKDTFDFDVQTKTVTYT